MGQFILVINGPICSGKSTIVELLLSRHEKLFRASYDKIKWLISDYSSDKYHVVVTDLVLTLAEAAFSKGFSIIADGAMLKTMRERYSSFAERNAVKFFEVNLEAPVPVLEERLKKRVVEATRLGTKISVTDTQGMMKIFARYQENKNISIPTFDSSILTPEQIAAEIEKVVVF